MKNTLSLSIVIPVHQEPIKSSSLIGGIILDLEGDDEVIIVLDQPKFYPEYIEEYKSKNQVRIICHTKNKGAAAARNSGIKEASCDIVVLIDSDIVLTSKWLYKHRNFHQHDPSNSILTGQTMIVGDAWYKKIVISSPLFNVGYGLNANDALKKLLWAPSSNLSFRKSIWERVKFNETFPRGGGGEDVLWCFQVSQFAVLIPKGPPVCQPIWGSSWEICKRMFRWGAAEPKIMCYLESNNIFLNKCVRNIYRDGRPTVATSLWIWLSCMALSLIYHFSAVVSAIRIKSPSSAVFTYKEFG